MTLREAFVSGLTMEQRWNERAEREARPFTSLPVSRLPYRAARGIRFAWSIVREKIAIKSAPWIVYPDILRDHGIVDGPPTP